ncbi:MAG: 50S ribosomal protein L30 [Bacteroidia bacterium]|nr:50S ribosomal protein L30 [Bacteroidia bacterium]
MATVKIKQIKSNIGCPKVQKRTLEALGLKKNGDIIEIDASPQIIGMINKIKHLIKIEYLDNLISVCP